MRDVGMQTSPGGVKAPPVYRPQIAVSQAKFAPPVYRPVQHTSQRKPAVLVLGVQTFGTPTQKQQPFPQVQRFQAPPPAAQRYSPVSSGSPARQPASAFPTLGTSVRTPMLSLGSMPANALQRAAAVSAGLPLSAGFPQAAPVFQPPQLRPATFQATWPPSSIQRLAIGHTQIHQQYTGHFGAPQSIQCYGGVIQPSLWDYAGYITDALSVAGIIATLTSSAAIAAGASGWGWLAPMLLPFCTSFASDALKIEGKKRGYDDQFKTRTGGIADYEPSIAKFVTGATAVVFTIAKLSASWGGWTIVITALAWITQFVLEYIRVRNVDRDTIYKLVSDTVKQCRERNGENAPLSISAA